MDFDKVIIYSSKAMKYINKIPEPKKSKLKTKIEEFYISEGRRHKKLGGYELSNSLRVGKYRILYIMENDIMNVVKIETRGDVYKGGY